MRVLITNERLDQRAGSDLFARDLARGLQRAGHFAIVYSSNPSEVERLLDRDEIPVAADLDALPFRPDVIHARHHLDAMTAVMALPGVPAIHHCVGPAATLLLPVHPRIHRYLAPSPAVAGWVEREGGIPRRRIDIAPSPVDLERFRVVRRAPETPRSILVYDDVHHPDDQLVTAIREAAAELGMRLALIGRRLGRTVENPEVALLAHDIVFAAGRKAVEALACGCGLVTIGAAGVGEMVLPGSFHRMRGDDFAAPDEGPPPTPDRIRTEVGRYSAGACLDLAAEMRRLADFASFVRDLEGTYRAAIAMNDQSAPDPDAELVAASDYVEGLSRLLKRMDMLQRQKGDIAVSTAAMLFAVSAKLAAVQAELDKPNW